MGANQSQAGANSVISQGNDGSRAAGGILVVNPTPGAQASQEQIVLPKRVPPVLGIENNQGIDPQRHKPDRDQLQPQLWTDFANNLSEFASSRSELVASRQQRLQEKIVLLDGHVQVFTDSYVNEKHKALARMNDDCKRLEEIERQLEKCTLQGELCAGMLNKINFLLPEGDRLEPFE